jgi:hypothetical protein
MRWFSYSGGVSFVTRRFSPNWLVPRLTRLAYNLDESVTVIWLDTYLVATTEHAPEESLRR